ncbi:MAG: hypothetical protein QM779_04875 [Propionicimonas sp.]
MESVQGFDGPDQWTRSDINAALGALALLTFAGCAAMCAAWGR